VALHKHQHAWARRTSSRLLLALASFSRRESLRLAVAGNEALGPRTAMRLALSGRDTLEYRLAGNPASTPALLAHLATSVDRGVRRALTRHPDVPQATLEELALDRDVEVQLAALANERVSPEVLEEAYRGSRGDERTWVRDALLRHPQAPEAVLEEVLEDAPVRATLLASRNPFVSARLLRRARVGAVELEVMVEHGRLDEAVLDLAHLGFEDLGSLVSAAEVVRRHRSPDMVLTLARAWEGTFEALLEVTDALDEEET
jgi:hypothetical protein